MNYYMLDKKSKGNQSWQHFPDYVSNSIYYEV